MARPNKGPQLKLNNRGIWMIHWTEERRSRRVSTKTDEKAEAEKRFAEWQETKTLAQLGLGPLTVTDALSVYVKQHVSRSSVDAKAIEATAERLRSILGQHVVTQMDDRHTAAYVDSRRAQGRADSTIRKELGVLVAALRYCVKTRRLKQGDVPYIALPAAGRPKDTWLTEQQVEALLAWLDEQDEGKRMSRVHRFVVLALATGARKAAIEALTWDDVELREGLIRYDRQARTITKKRKVPVPIADWLEPYLRRMEEEAEGPYVLDSKRDVRAAFDVQMKRAARETGVAAFDGLTRHALRHTCATLALRAGCSLWQVAGLIGNTPEQVAHTYGHHAQDHIREAANSWRKTA